MRVVWVAAFFLRAWRQFCVTCEFAEKRGRIVVGVSAVEAGKRGYAPAGCDERVYFAKVRVFFARGVELCFCHFPPAHI